MTLQKLKISDNINLSYISTSKFKSGTLTFSFQLPLCERDYLLGTVLSGVMRRGTEKYPSMSLINRRLDELYASCVDVQCVIHGNVLFFNISADMLDARFAIDGTDISGEVCRVIAQILLSPLMSGGRFPDACVESEKAFAKDALSAEKNNTKLYAATRLKELMKRGAQDGFPTLKYLLENIDAVTSEELTAFYKAKICTSPLHVFYIGSETAERISKKITDAFSHFNGHGKVAFSPIQAETACDFLSLTEDMPVNQGKLALGMRTGQVLGSRHDCTAIVLNEIFGASPASKLFLNVRERLGLCYYCSSSYGLLSGNLTVSSGIDIASRDRATEEILKQFDEIKRGNITDTELYAARKSLEYSYIQIYDSPFSLQSFYTIRDIMGVDETPDECKARLLSVTKEEICTLASSTVYDTCFFINGLLGGKEEIYDE